MSGREESHLGDIRLNLPLSHRCS